jgi:AcrR family transcriptional regulator
LLTINRKKKPLKVSQDSLSNSRKKNLTINRKKEILKAAQEIFSQKGLVDSNISEIAKKAKVADSIIYHYFKNKEDLLFFAVSDKLVDVKKDLDLHLDGILDPVSKLSKTIWYHLYINDFGTTRILKDLLFECRSNKNFYSHEGYQTLRDYIKFMSQILQQGVDEGIFQPDINMILVRNIIFGLLDEETLSCLVCKEIDSTLPDFPGIMDLVFAIISKDKTPSLPPDENGNKEDRILKAAVQVFSNKGYNAATMNEIAKAANVADGTIYTYFNNKEDMLFSIPIKRFQSVKNSMGEIFHIQNPLRKFRRYIRLMFTSVMIDRNFLGVFLLDIKLNKNFYTSPLYKDYIDFISILDTILEEGKEQGVFRESINPRLFRNLFLGGVTHLTTKWVILEKNRPFDKMKEIEELLGLLCRSIVVDIPGLKKLEDQID